MNQQKTKNITGKITASIWILSILAWVSLGTLVVFVQYNIFNLAGELPSLEELGNPRSSLASELYSSDRMLLGKYFRENRTTVTYSEVSKNMLDALYATEDIRFEEHSGIDFKGTFAILFYLMRGDLRGSSTISQQTAKNLFKTRAKAYRGSLGNVPILKKVIIKIKEWITAIRLERSYTKTEILMMYLNTVEFGSNSFGVRTAAETFFNTTTDSLTVAQAALLVGVLKAPSAFSPILNPDRSFARRNVVLGQMLKYNKISKAVYDSLRIIPINLHYNVENQNTGLAPYFREIVKKKMQRWCAENGYDLYNSGLKIYTTINSKMQKYAEQAVDEHMSHQQELFYKHWKGRRPWINEDYREIKNFIGIAIKKTQTYRNLRKRFGNNKDSIRYYLHKKKRMRVFAWKGEIDTVFSSIDSITYYKYFLRTGMMAMDPEMGHIKAWVGGINHKYFKYDHVYQGKRQPGSLFKPFVYTAAIDNGYSPCMKVADVPVTFDLPEGKRWIPRNSDGKYSGELLTLRVGLARSINSITAWVMKQMGPANVVKYARRMGITGFLDPIPALCLGTSDVSVYEIVGAYCTFVNHGVWTEPILISRIEDKNGNILHEFIPRTVEALSEEAAYKMLFMLRGATEERNGTAIALRTRHKFTNEIAAKTGTTQNYSDGWFVGVTQNLVTGIWVGGEDKFIHFRSMALGQGARMAMPLWARFMRKVYADSTIGVLPEPFKKPLLPRYDDDLNCGRKKVSKDTLNKVNEKTLDKNYLRFNDVF